MVDISITSRTSKKEGVILCMGNMNINLEKLEYQTYYLRKLAEDYQTLICECELKVLNFGITLTRIHKDNMIKESAVDHGITNKLEAISYHSKFQIDYSDHYLICVDLNMDVQKQMNNSTVSRDFRKLRSNPKYFLNKLAQIEWESFVNMGNVDEMQNMWTTKINECLDSVAPWISRKVKSKKHSLPKHIQLEIKKRKLLQMRHERKVRHSEVDHELIKELKKHNNYCNKLIKKAVREMNGQNITSVSSVKEVWNSLNDILKPDRVARNSLKIETENKSIEDPLELAESFNNFFKEKVEGLAPRIKNDRLTDPLPRLREKLHDCNLKFSLKTVSESEVLKILKSLKPKKSYGIDGITAEVLKLGADVLVVPLTYIINFSIVTGKHPTNWKISKVIPLHKKGDKRFLKNYRPVALLPVSGMILEKIVAIQIENFFEEKQLLGSFQFGFRVKKSTISELLTLFDTLLEAKNQKKEILVLLYDLSAAFDTVSHQILINKLIIYGFDKNAIHWIIDVPDFFFRGGVKKTP